MVFTVIKGNGSNGGDQPEEPMYLYYKTSPEQAAPTFLQEIVSSAVGASGYAQYEIDLDENHAARVGGIYLYLQQVRPSGGDNTEENKVDWGKIAVWGGVLIAVGLGAYFIFRKK